LGYSVLTFESTLHFLESGRLAETSCVITDVQMSWLSGLDLQTRVLADGSRMPVISLRLFPWRLPGSEH
jgi:FixJ family two-component response regulator